MNMYYSFNFFFGLLRAAPTEYAYGGAQARGQIGAMPDPSRVCDLHHNSRLHWILNPLSKARDQTHVLMDTSWVGYH